MPMLARFSSVRPRYEVTQEASLAWLARAHAAAEAASAGLDDAARQRFEDQLNRVLGRCACPPGKIDRRGLAIGELETARWADNVIYDLAREPHGAGTHIRTRVFGELVDDYFRDAYCDDDEPPDDLIHVTCTGYLSPSGAQQLVAHKRWPTRVTHAYQMGCYAAIPASRIAAGFIACGAQRVDLVHTELCTLHLDPTNHALDQLVVHSLFADGLIRYSMVGDETGPGLVVRGLHEVIVPESGDAMSWTVGDHGMQMTLARDVPDRIAGALRGFVEALYRRGGRDLGALRDSCFAVHPGGPKIIDRVREMLELDESQLAASRAVLREHGNMSSATLPHIWERVLADPSIPPGTLVPSLAFGPGLSVCGALLEKR
ncbi:MAG TPA: 3-oxoacyl-[acyl-carrier-protein] synthase III C-terminal domain-containing protein [Kofleriaceae bacterium]|nr:3-oxoacyl-[acyl-carrier-protein] synthase III C-terminal domain-containing protein [Kofleriaceae bacterium]